MIVYIWDFFVKSHYYSIYSFPYDYNSVNFNIPDHYSRVHYSTLADAIQIINKLDNPYLEKSDISEALR